jgi:hypothetical protein
LRKNYTRIDFSTFQSRQSYLCLIPAYFTFEKVAAEKEIHTFYK